MRLGFAIATALWAVLFAAYAATLGIDAFQASDYGGDEPHYLLAAESIVSDGDLWAVLCRLTIDGPQARGYNVSSAHNSRTFFSIEKSATARS